MIAIMAITGACSRHAPTQQAGPPPEVGVVTVRAQDVPLEVVLPGRTSPFSISDVRPQVAGIVQARLFREGADVREGQALYQIDPSTYQAAVNEARAQLANAQATVGANLAKAERYRRLLQIGAVSQQDYEAADSAYRQSVATVQQSQALLQSAQINLGYTKIRAPISGRIGRSAFTEGALVTAGQADALTTIQKLDPIFVDMTQSTAELLNLEHDIAQGEVRNAGALRARVRLVLEDGRIYPEIGNLEFTDVTVDQTSGTVTLRALFPNPNNVLLPGMYVRARVIEGVAHNAVLAPQQGVAHDPKGNATALVVNKQGRVEQRPLEIARAVDDSWLVTKGLSSGDRVIIEGTQKVRPGMPVRAVPARVPQTAPGPMALNQGSSAKGPGPATSPQMAPGPMALNPGSNGAAPPRASDQQARMTRPARD